MADNRRNSGRDQKRDFQPNEFSVLLRKYRLERTAFTQKQLGDELGYSDGTISNYESGASFPTSRSVAVDLSIRLGGGDLVKVWEEVRKERRSKRKPRETKKATPVIQQPIQKPLSTNLQPLGKSPNKKSKRS